MFWKKKQIKEANELLNRGINLAEKNPIDLNLTYDVFQRASTLFKKLGDKYKHSEEICNAYLAMLEGYMYREKKDWIEAMKSFGKANVLFTALKDEKMAKKMRYEQAIAQSDFAKQKALNGEFEEAARLYESAAAVFQMIGKEKEAASARGKGFVQRAALVDDDFAKSNFLTKAVEEFRRARDLNPIIEAHALFYRARSLVDIKPRDAIQTFTRALEKYERIGAFEQVNRVKQIIAEVKQKRKV